MTEMQIFNRDADPLPELAKAALALGKPVRVRIQPQIMDFPGEQYRAWVGFSRTFDFASQGAAENFRNALDCCFRLAGLWGPTAFAQYLSDVEAAALKAQQGGEGATEEVAP